MISQTRTMDSKRLIEKMGTLDQKDFERVKLGFLSMFVESKIANERV